MEILLFILTVLAVTITICLFILTIVVCIWCVTYIINAITDNVVDFLLFWRYKEDSLKLPEDKNS